MVTTEEDGVNLKNVGSTFSSVSWDNPAWERIERAEYQFYAKFPKKISKARIMINGGCEKKIAKWKNGKICKESLLLVFRETVIYGGFRKWASWSKYCSLIDYISPLLGIFCSCPSKTSVFGAGSRPLDKEGGRSSRPLDKGGWSRKIFLRASVLSKNKGGAGPLPWIRHCYWSRHLVHQNKQTPSPKFCIGFVFHFSCVWQSSQEKLKTFERFRVKFTGKGKREIQVENVSKLNM